MKTFPPDYQLDLTTPGSMPVLANSRKQIRQIENFRIYPRGRPHRWQRLYFLTLNLGSNLCLTIKQVFAIMKSLIS